MGIVVKAKLQSKPVPPIRHGHFFRSPALGLGQLVRAMVLVGVFTAAVLMMSNGAVHARTISAAERNYAQLDLGTVKRSRKARSRKTRGASAQKKKLPGARRAHRVEANIPTQRFKPI